MKIIIKKLFIGILFNILLIGFIPLSLIALNNNSNNIEINTNESNLENLEWFNENKITISEMASGIYHSLVLSDTGDVYSFGLNSNGQLGHGDEKNRSTPTKINKFDDVIIKSISAGNYYSLVLTNEGDLYSFGSNISGQLGHEDKENRSTPTKIETFNETTITDMAAGSHHSLVLTEDNDVYSFGWNIFGQLGHGDEDNRLTPTKIDALDDLTITKIEIGGHSSFSITEEGEIYSFGWNIFGQLGQGDENNRSTPTIIDQLNETTIIDISSGDYHSLVLTEDNDVYSFGLNDNGQLGHGDKRNRNFPKKISELYGIEVIDVAASCHSLVLTNTNDVYSFGLNEDGQLGHGDWDERLTPTKIDFFNEIKIKDISTGWYHSLTLSDEGKVYSFGWNYFGQLGQGNDESRWEPTEIKTYILFESNKSIWSTYSSLIIGLSVGIPLLIALISTSYIIYKRRVNK